MKEKVLVLRELQRARVRVRQRRSRRLRSWWTGLEYSEENKKLSRRVMMMVMQFVDCLIAVSVLSVLRLWLFHKRGNCISAFTPDRL